MIWLTTPMQGSPKKRSHKANADWLRATAQPLAMIVSNNKDHSSLGVLRFFGRRNVRSKLMSSRGMISSSGTVPSSRIVSH